MSIIAEIKNILEEKINEKKEFIIFPFGDIGMQVKKVLEEAYGILPKYILDNYLYKYNKNIKPLSFLKEVDCDKYILILACKNKDIYQELKENIRAFFSEDNIIEFNENKKEVIMENKIKERKRAIIVETEVGKYSYGPLCNHPLVKKVGAFCSFAQGCTVVENHAIQYISTHPFLWHGAENNEVYNLPYSELTYSDWFFCDVIPKKGAEKLRKITIGSDVWLGHNVIITNGASIGNGVIAGAGAVITKDVPDYAIVGGVPAKIIRYRYESEQINALNKIQWWNWSDEEIRQRYDDFYLPIEKFINKYL